MREQEGQAAPNCARVALLQTAPISRAAQKPEGRRPRLSRDDAEALNNGSGHYMALRLLEPTQEPPALATPSRDLAAAVAEIGDQLARHAARVGALANGAATTEDVDDIDRLTLDRAVAYRNMPAAQAVAGLSRLVGTVEARWQGIVQRLDLSEAAPDALAPDVPPGSPAPCTSSSSTPPRASPELEPRHDVDLIVADLVRRARSVSSVASKWRTCLERDLETTEDERTKADVRTLLADPRSTDAPLPQSFPTV